MNPFSNNLDSQGTISISYLVTYESTDTAILLFTYRVYRAAQKARKGADMISVLSLTSPSSTESL